VSKDICDCCGRGGKPLTKAQAIRGAKQLAVYGERYLVVKVQRTTYEVTNDLDLKGYDDADNRCIIYDTGATS
jgi:hypothetical protein